MISVGDEVFWLYNPNLYGYVASVSDDTFDIFWESDAVRKTYPFESLQALGFFDREDDPYV